VDEIFIGRVDTNLPNRYAIQPPCDSADAQR
jgi:hypothetical protein